jgi:hypothetical protein
VAHDLEWIVHAGSLQSLAVRMGLSLDGNETASVLRRAKALFDAAYPQYADSGLQREDHQILLRREFVLAASEVLRDEITKAVKRYPTVDYGVAVDLRESILPNAFSAETEPGRLRAVDPMMWRYKHCSDICGGAENDQRPTDRELALIRVERMRDLLLASEEAVGGADNMRRMVSAICAINRGKGIQR